MPLRYLTNSDPGTAQIMLQPVPKNPMALVGPLLLWYQM